MKVWMSHRVAAYFVPRLQDVSQEAGILLSVQPGAEERGGNFVFCKAVENQRGRVPTRTVIKCQANLIACVWKSMSDPAKFVNVDAEGAIVDKVCEPGDSARNPHE